MKLKIFVVFIITLCFNCLLFSQTKSYSDILPKDIEAKPILDSSGYLPDSLKQLVLSNLKAKGFDLTKCFVDKKIHFDQKEEIISIRIWDIDELKDRKNSEKSRKSIPYQYTHTGFYSGEILYNKKTKTVEFRGDQ